MLRAGPLSGFQSLAWNRRTYLSFRAWRFFVEFEIRKISPFDRNDRG
jgi:hypothetical protein